MSNKFLKATTAKEWRDLQNNGILFTFSSGFTARVRPVPISKLYKMGKIPTSLMPMVAELSTTDGIKGADSDDPEKAEKVIKELFTLLDIICEAAFIEPKVVFTEEEIEGDEDTITVDDISTEDKKELLIVTQAPSSALISFRKEQEGDVGAVQSGQDVHDTPKQDS